MKINFTKKEYITLLEMMHLAGWMLHSYRTDQPPDRQAHRQLEEKILSLAREFGCDDVVQFDQKLNAHFLTREFEGKVMPFIDEYDDDNLWTELTERLVWRDVVRAVGREKLPTLTVEERFEAMEPYDKKYNDEFQEHGLERLEIVSGPVPTGRN